MKCPTCPDQVLQMADRSGIEIDYCPSCRGVWLDRGELDKIIERSVPTMTPAASPPPSSRARVDDRWESGRSDDRRDDDRYGKPKRRKKEGFLGELFDF